MKEFIKELKSEFIKIEKSTRPQKSTEMLGAILDKTNNGISLGDLESKLKLKLSDLLLKYNIEELNSDTSTEVENLFIQIAKDRIAS